MERYRLKTIMILILSMVNIFLLSYLTWQYLSDWSARRRMEEQLTVLFAMDGITLLPDGISHERPPDCILLPRDEDLEANVAAFFLEGRVLLSSQGGIREYSAGDCAARFYSNGEFAVSGLSVREEPEELCRRFCRTFSYQLADTPELETGALTAAARYRGRTIVNCHAFFSFENGVLRGVSGVLLPQSGTAAQDEPPLNAVEALAVFQSMQRENRDVVSVVSGVSPCYELRDDAALGLLLEPAWRIDTDTVTYYVNGVTGAASSA